MSAVEPKESHFIEVGRPINEIVADLSKPIPEKYLSTRTQGGKQLTYISWHHATKLLDYFAPGWSYTIEFHHVGNKVVAVATIIIRAKEGQITRQASGCEDDDKSGYGDPFSNSESMALRRAAAKYGLGRYLYNK